MTDTLGLAYIPFRLGGEPLIKGIADETEHAWRIDGPLSHFRGDLEGDEMDQEGLAKAMEPFQEWGCPVDWNHLYKPTQDLDYILGQGVAFHKGPHPRDSSEVLFMGTDMDRRNHYAQRAHRYLLRKGALGYSAQGMIELRKGSRIVKPYIEMVGLTTHPIVTANGGTIQIAKAMSAWMTGDTDPLAALRRDAGPEFELQIPYFGKSLTADGTLPRAAGAGFDPVSVENVAGRAPARKRRRKRRVSHAEHALYKALCDCLCDRLGELAAG